MRSQVRPVGALGFGALAALAWPIVVQRGAQAVVGLADALMVASLGEVSLTAVTAGAMNVACLFVLPIGVVSLVQSFAAQLQARGDAAGVRRYGWYGIGLSVAATLLGLALVPLVWPVMAILDYEPFVRDQMSLYSGIRLAGMGPVVALEAMSSWYGGRGNTRAGMFASLLVMGANVALNAVLIHGALGLPGYGVAGAAWASVIASLLGPVALIVPFLFMGSVRAGRLRLAEVRRLIRFGLPTGLNWFFEFSAFVVFVNVSVAALGTVTTSALMAVIQLNAVSFMPAFGIATAASIQAGRAIGGGRRDLVGGVLLRAVAVCAVWQCAIGALYLAFPDAIMSWFALPGARAAEFLAIAAPLLALSAAWQLFDAIGIITNEVLRAAGDTVVPLVIRMVVAWCVFVPGAHLAITLARDGGQAAMLAIIGYIGALAALLGWRFASGAWRSIRLVEDPRARLEPGAGVG